MHYEARLGFCTQYLSFASCIPVGFTSRDARRRLEGCRERRDLLFPILLALLVGNISAGRISVSVFDSSLLISRNSIDVPLTQ